MQEQGRQRTPEEIAEAYSARNWVESSFQAWKAGEPIKPPTVNVERVWERRVLPGIREYTGKITPNDVLDISMAIGMAGMNLPQSIAEEINIEAGVLEEAAKRENPQFPQGMIGKWYAHTTAFLLHARPPGREHGGMFANIRNALNEERGVSIPEDTVREYAGDDENPHSPISIVRTLILHDPSGVSAVQFIANNPEMRAQRATKEQHPQIVEELIQQGSERYLRYLTRMREELPPEMHPGAEDRPEPSSVERDQLLETTIQRIWEDEVRENLEDYTRDDFLPGSTEAVIEAVRGGANYLQGIHFMMDAEMDRFAMACRENVAFTFPVGDVKPAYLDALYIVTIARESSSEEHMREAYMREVVVRTGIDNPRGVVRERIDTDFQKYMAGIRRREELYREDPSGFSAMDHALNDPEQVAERRRSTSHPDMMGEIGQLGAERYAKWYLHLAENGLVPFPSSDTPFYNPTK